MKDALGHGSDSRGGGAAHQSGVSSIAGPPRMVPINSLHPRPENSAMLDKLNRLEDTREAAFKAAYPHDTYTRQGPREDIEKYRAAVRSGAKFPPLAVNKDGSIEDGERRWRAFKAEGAKMVQVRLLK